MPYGVPVALDFTGAAYPAVDRWQFSGGRGRLAMDRARRQGAATADPHPATQRRAVLIEAALVANDGW